MTAGQAGAKLGRTLRIASAVLGVVWLLVAAIAAYSSYQGLRSNGFTKVAGEVIDQNTTTSTRRRPGRTSRELRRHRSQYTTIGYVYEVGDTMYFSDRYQAGTFGLEQPRTPGGANARYRVGGPVEVFVDPNDPSNAVLEPGISGIARMLFVILGILTFGLLVLRVATSPPHAAAG
jgi:hypothetical protein